MFAERLQYREDDLTARGINGQSFQKVEAAIGAGVMLLVQAVEVHHANQLLTADRTFIQVLHVRSYRVVSIGDVEFEFLRLNTRGTEGIDILHHQVPCAAVLFRRGVRAGLQHLQRQSVRGTQFFVSVRRKLTDLIDTAVIGVFIGNCQHFVLVQRRLQGDITQGTIQRVLTARQQTCRLDLLEVHTALHAVQSLKGRTGLLQVAEIGRTDRSVQAVGVVLRRTAHRTAPTLVLGMTGTLAEVREGDDITCLVVVTPFIGHPYLDLINRHTARDIRHAGHGAFVLIAEEMAQEEVAVLIVVVAADIEAGGLCSAFTAYRLCLAVLLTD